MLARCGRRWARQSGCGLKVAGQQTSSRGKAATRVCIDHMMANAFCQCESPGQAVPSSSLHQSHDPTANSDTRSSGSKNHEDPEIIIYFKVETSFRTTPNISTMLNSILPPPDSVSWSHLLTSKHLVIGIAGRLELHDDVIF